MAYGGDSQAEYDYGEEEYDYDDAYEEEYDAEPVQLEPGAGRASVLDASTVAEQSRRRGLMLGRLSYRHTAGS